jgi:threonine synthase
MILYSTRHIAPEVDLEQAVKTGLPPDNGLYMPSRIPTLSAGEIGDLVDMPFNDMAHSVLSRLFGDYFPAGDLRGIIDAAFDFDAPIHWLDNRTGILELFHGPTLAFKDFGARFMGRLLEYFLQEENDVVDILVATSGDTGSAVAHGFLDTHGIRVTILYPKNKVSDIQEKQFATLGRNIRVLEVDGTFDDCQRLVKEAFLDKELNRSLTLSSANSINIARLIPQSLYYFRAYCQLPEKDRHLVFSIPSGNFGNLTAGLLAWRMGLPIHRIVASNNANDVFTQYWHSGDFEPRPSVQTLSNAMDVGDPSNFKRILDLYGNDWKAIRSDISAFTYTDEETSAAIKQVYHAHGYIMCPHTAVGYLGLRAYRDQHALDANYIGLATAHPVKFLETVESAIGRPIAIPDRLEKVLGAEKLSISIPNDYSLFREFLMQKK